MKPLYTMIFLTTITLSGCASTPVTEPEQKVADRCQQQLSTAYKELNFSKANGFGGTVEYTKAASILGFAKVQSGIGNYSSCIEQVASARDYIKASRQ